MISPSPLPLLLLLPHRYAFSPAHTLQVGRENTQPDIYWEIKTKSSRLPYKKVIYNIKLTFIYMQMTPPPTACLNKLCEGFFGKWSKSFPYARKETINFLLLFSSSIFPLMQLQGANIHNLLCFFLIFFFFCTPWAFPSPYTGPVWVISHFLCLISYDLHLQYPSCHSDLKERSSDYHVA